MRIQVELSDNIVERANDLAKHYGISRSQLLAFYICDILQSDYYITFGYNFIHNDMDKKLGA